MKIAPITYLFLGNVPNEFTPKLRKFSFLELLGHRKRVTAINQPQVRVYSSRSCAGGKLVSSFDPVKFAIENDSAKQDWHSIDGLEIGVAKEYDNGDFAKEVIYSGYGVTLGDGKEYLIPVARLTSTNCQIPRTVRKDSDGVYSKNVQEKFQDLCDFALKSWLDLIDNEGVLDLPPEQEVYICTLALQINYDLTENEICALGLLSDDAIKGIFGAIVDIHGFRELSNADKSLIAERDLWKQGNNPNYQPTMADLAFEAEKE